MDRDGAKIGCRREGCIGSRKIILYEIIRRRKLSLTEDNRLDWRQEERMYKDEIVMSIISTVEDEAHQLSLA